MVIRASELWHGVREEIAKAVAKSGLERVIVASTANGRVKIQELGAPSALGEEFARLAGFKLDAGAKVLTGKLGDKRIILGEIQNTAPTKRTFEHDIDIAGALVATKGVNSPALSRYSQDSADTGSNSSTSTWATNFDWDWALPDGTWTVMAETTQLISHGTSSGVIRVRTTIDGTAGTNLSGSAPVNPTRACWTTEGLVTGLTGTITIAGQYRPNASGTAYAGGGMGRAIAFRTS